MPATISKTIGVGKDYPSIDAWVAGAAATYPGGLVAADVIWRGVLYKEGSGTNNEWQITSSTTQYTLTCDVNRYYLLEAAPGQSFSEDAGKLTNALRYNSANGVSIAVTSNYVWLFRLDAAARLEISGLQINLNFNRVNSGLGTLIVKRSIIVSNNDSVFLNNSSAFNSLLESNSSTHGITASNSLLENQAFVNCTFIGSGFTHAFLLANYSKNNVFRNCAFYGFTTGQVDVPSHVNSSLSSHNATDLASFSWSNSTNIVNKPFANQFESISSVSQDFRIKAGSALISAGVVDSAFNEDVDIIGSSRSSTAPTIGAWEFASAASGSSEMSEKSISRGIARGFERGIV